MTTPIDCRGLACPAPVLRTKGALEALGEGVLEVLVDNPAARENVQRFAESQGCAVTVQDEGAGAWRLTAVRGAGSPAAAPAPAAAPTPAALPTALLVTSDRLGPDAELGAILMKAFLATLVQASDLPAKVLFLNRGVHLTTHGSAVLDVVADLERAGVQVLSCGTCLEFFGRRDQLAVGRVSNMYDTVETLTGAFRVVTIS